MDGLSDREAFQAMTLYTEQFYDRAGDDLATLMLDISIEENGRTHDPAAWEDWMKCVRAVQQSRESPNGCPAGS